MTNNSENPESLRIAVLLGGDSRERNVSLDSGAAVTKSLVERNHRVAEIDPAEVDLTLCPWDQFDAVFIALHGTFGEDGQVQKVLDDIGIPYTGCDAETSQLAFSKSASKERFLQAEVPTPPYILIHESDNASRIQKHAKALGYPLVVKPENQGSSLGVSLVESPDDLPAALARCFHFDAFGLLEAAVLGSEWTLGMLDNTMLPLIQIETEQEFFNYDAKYEDDATKYKFEFDVPTDVVQKIEQVGQAACQSLNTTGLVRVDIRLDRMNRPWVLEVNTIPGLTDHSLIPKSAGRLGLSLGELCEQTILRCLKRPFLTPNIPSKSSPEEKVNTVSE